MRALLVALAAAPCAGHKLPSRSDAHVFSGASHGGCSLNADYPLQYVTYRTTDRPVIDGKLDEALWAEVPWTNDFVDISTDQTPRKKTRAKMRWDDGHLYVGAYLEEDEIWANITKDDEVIFHDNDFEVFVDPGGSTHFYKEIEINARGKVWDLCINRPYGEGGYENSSRTYGRSGFGIPGLQSAVTIDGTLNDATSKSKSWTVEMAIPVSSLLVNSTGGEPPAPGRYWRLDFSRVQWRVLRKGAAFWKDPKYKAEDNWVWQPIGVINMHNPERWGYLQFADTEVNKTSLVKDPEWPVRLWASKVFHAQKDFGKKNKGVFAKDLQELRGSNATSMLETPCGLDTKVTCTNADCKAFKVRVASPDGKCVAVIDHRRHISMDSSSCGDAGTM
jgi:hypothetical protein